MSIDLNDPKWSHIAKYLRKLNLDFDRNIKGLISERTYTRIRPQTKSTCRRGISMKMIMDDGFNTPPVDSEIDP